MHTLPLSVALLKTTCKLRRLPKRQRLQYMLIRLQSESIFYSEKQLLGGQTNSLHQISVDDNLPLYGITICTGRVRVISTFKLLKSRFLTARKLLCL